MESDAGFDSLAASEIYVWYSYYSCIVLDCRGIAPRIAPAKPVVNGAKARATRCCRQCERSIRYCHQCEQRIAAPNTSSALMSSMRCSHRRHHQCTLMHALLPALLSMRCSHYCRHHSVANWWSLLESDAGFDSLAASEIHMWYMIM